MFRHRFAVKKITKSQVNREYVGRRIIATTLSARTRIGTRRKAARRCGDGSIMECARRWESSSCRWLRMRHRPSNRRGAVISEGNRESGNDLPSTRKGDGEQKCSSRWHPPCQWTTPLSSLAQNLLDHGDVAASRCFEQLLILAHGPFTPRSSPRCSPALVNLCFHYDYSRFIDPAWPSLGRLMRRDAAASRGSLNWLDWLKCVMSASETTTRHDTWLMNGVSETARGRA